MPSLPPLTWKKRLKIAVASTGGTLLMRVLGATMRLRAPTTFEGMDRDRGPQGHLLFALWHGDHFPILYACRRRGIYVVTSRSADGQILTNILQNFGYRCVRGSSTRGGTRALVDLTRAVRSGADAAIAVDGPKGPRRIVKPGIILLAKLTGCPIIPAGAALTRSWQFHSWDRYRIPKPFCRSIILPGEPLAVPPDADDAVIESKRLELQQTLLALQDRAEQEAAKL